MSKWFLFSLCMLFGAVLSPLQAGEDGNISPDSVRKQVDSSLWINGASPHLAPVYFTGVICKLDAWKINILSLNGHELPEPMTVALEKEPAGFSSARETSCCGIIPVLIPSGAEGESRLWRSAGASPAVVMKNTPQALSLLQEAVLQSYQHHLMKSLHMAAGILDRMTDERQALKMEKNWAYENMDCIFWILLEGSLPLDARMACVTRHPDLLEQSQKASDAYAERLRILQGKPWSGKLRLLKREFEPPLPSADGSCPAVRGFRKQECGSSPNSRQPKAGHPERIGMKSQEFLKLKDSVEREMKRFSLYPRPYSRTGRSCARKHEGGIDTAGGRGYSPAAYNDQFYQYQRGRGDRSELLFS